MVRRIAVGRYPDAVAAGFGSLWTANLNSDTVTRVDLATDAGAVTVTGRSVWVASYLGHVVTRLDAAGRIEGTVPMGSEPNGLVAFRGHPWVTESGAGDLAEVAPVGSDQGAWP